MLKKYRQYISPLFLLLIYIFSNIPFALLHQHHDHIIDYEKASACEKSIYYGSKKENCGHTSHIYKTIKHCKLCELHTITPHQAIHTIAYLFSQKYFKEYPQIPSELLLSTSFVISNKGPPAV
jgi:hypothetical protein